MAMSHDEIFKAVLRMIHVTPEDYRKLNADIILYLCQVVAEAEELNKPRSAYDDLTPEQIKERMTFGA